MRTRSLGSLQQRRTTSVWIHTSQLLALRGMEMTTQLQRVVNLSVDEELLLYQALDLLMDYMAESAELAELTRSYWQETFAAASNMKTKIRNANVI